jgi:hypothetical protein
MKIEAGAESHLNWRVNIPFDLEVWWRDRPLLVRHGGLAGPAISVENARVA